MSFYDLELTSFSSTKQQQIRWNNAQLAQRCLLNSGVVGLAPKWVRLVLKGTNPGLFQIRFQIWSENAQDLSHLGPIWPTLEPNLPSLLTICRDTVFFIWRNYIFKSHYVPLTVMWVTDKTLWTDWNWIEDKIHTSLEHSRRLLIQNGLLAVFRKWHDLHPIMTSLTLTNIRGVDFIGLPIITVWR